MQRPCLELVGCLICSCSGAFFKLSLSKWHPIHLSLGSVVMGWLLIYLFVPIYTYWHFHVKSAVYQRTCMRTSIQFSVYIHLNNRYEYIHTCSFLLDVFHIGNHACFDRLSRTSLVIHLNISLTRLLLQARSSAVLFIYLGLYYIKSAAYIWT